MAEPTRWVVIRMTEKQAAAAGQRLNQLAAPHHGYLYAGELTPLVPLRRAIANRKPVEDHR